MNPSITLLVPILAIMIPIIAVVMVFGTAMLSIYLSYRKRQGIFTQYHQERMLAIEKGTELPPLPEDLFSEDGGRKKQQFSSHAALLWGLILLLGGGATGIALHFVVHREEGYGEVSWFALIPVGVGMVCLIYYAAVGRKIAAAWDAQLAAERAAAKQS